MKVQVLNSGAQKVSEVNLKDDVYGAVVNEALFYEVVKMQLANRRSGTACTKTKGLVSGGGLKPWKQKGTGRARSGSIRSPLWRHGGTVFGPRPRDYSYDVPKKVKKEALKSALSMKAKDGSLKIFDSIELGQPKTKQAMELLKKAGLTNALIVVAGQEPNFTLAARNLKDFKVIDSAGINVYDVLNYEGLVMTKSAAEKIEAMLQ
ncbi:MAG: 50S ribosomal protein L4 [Deltaproteobacteria bacterium]|nr:50S ribosomal protein L4 [Deltaproteobacteria bacterium]